MTMSIPQKILMIHPTMITAVTIWITAAATLSQNTQQTPRSGSSSLRAPHSTVKAESRVPVEQRGEIIWSNDIPSESPLPKCLQMIAVPLPVTRWGS